MGEVEGIHYLLPFKNIWEKEEVLIALQDYLFEGDQNKKVHWAERDQRCNDRCC